MNLSPRNLLINKEEFEFYQLNQEGPEALFYPANGFPVGTYSEFLKQLLPNFQLSCLSPRACWPNTSNPPKQNNWENYADDLVSFIESKFDKPITVIGHSQGATAALIAASRKPKLFKSLILIEPASVSPALSFFIKLVPWSIKKYFQPFKSGLRKQNFWESRAIFYAHYRNNRAYKRFSEQVLQDYTKHGLRSNDKGGYNLTYPAAWETSNYALPPSAQGYLKKVSLPIQVIAGKPSLFFSQKVRGLWRKNSPESKFSILGEFGHLLPLEAPLECAKLIINASK